MIEVTTQAHLDKALKNRKPNDIIVCLGGTWNNPLVLSDSATVEASGSATVRAYDSATVEAYDSATVGAYDSATVEAYGSATVEAYDSATVRASGSATVRASKYVAVQKMPYGNPKITGGVLIVIPELKTAQDWCDYYGIEVKRGTATVFKAVDDDYSTNQARTRGIFYVPGSKPKCEDWNDRPECGGGLHASPRPFMARRYNENATRYVACPVKLAEIVVLGDKVKVPRISGAVYEVDEDGERV